MDYILQTFLANKMLCCIRPAETVWRSTFQILRDLYTANRASAQAPYLYTNVRDGYFLYFKNHKLENSVLTIISTRLHAKW